MSNAIRSRRATKEIESIYAVVVKSKRGREGVVRRETPFGTIPWTTDDPALAETVLRMAITEYTEDLDGHEITPAEFYLVRFDRVRS